MMSFWIYTGFIRCLITLMEENICLIVIYLISIFTTTRENTYVKLQKIK